MNFNSDFEQKTNEALIGKTIKSAEVNGHSVIITFEDGTEFYYDASDGGYSCWSVKKDGRRIV